MAHEEVKRKIAYMNKIEGYERFSFYQGKKEYLMWDQKEQRGISGLKEIRQALKTIKEK